MIFYNKCCICICSGTCGQQIDWLNWLLFLYYGILIEFPFLLNKMEKIDEIHKYSYCPIILLFTLLLL